MKTRKESRSGKLYETGRRTSKIYYFPDGSTPENYEKSVCYHEHHLEDEDGNAVPMRIDLWRSFLVKL